MHPRRTIVVLAVLGLLAGACGRGESPAERAARIDASRLLQQATFGPTRAQIERVAALGAAVWIDEQMALPATFHQQLVDQLAAEGEKRPNYDFRVEVWWRRSLEAPDQLRQRVAWALSQVFVVSDRADAIAYHLSELAGYYDLLLEHAFGTYGELLEAVTLNPQMGGYLSMLQNEKPDPQRNVYPDENYAREVMQLFSIGLVRLAQDGTPQRGSDGAPLPTYDQAIVEGLAHAFTGWNYAEADEWRYTNPSGVPMKPWDEYHDDDPKRLVGGHRTEGGETAREDLETVVRLLEQHPNVGPFLGRQLIQRLVTSNPSPAYVERVAKVFADDGSGVRGNLAAVVRAVLLDPEARAPRAAQPETFGKPREPLLRFTALWRAFAGESSSGWVDFPWPDRVIGQAPLRSPTVFNFYRPDHEPPGELSEAGLAAPELALATHTYLTRTTNELLARIHARPGMEPWRTEFDVTPNLWVADPYDAPDVPGMVIDASYESELDDEELVQHLELLLLGRPMSDELRAVVLEHLAREGERDILVRDVLFLVMSSPEYAVQR